MFGLIEFGRMLFIYTAVTSSSREAARYGAVVGVNADGIVRYKDCDGMRAAARRIGNLAGIQDTNIVIEYDHGPGTGIIGTCPPPGEPSTVELDRGDRILVRVGARYQMIVPMLSIQPFTITTSTARTLVIDVPVDSGLPATPVPPTDTPVPTDTPTATDTPATTDTPVPTDTPTDTPIPGLTPTDTPTLVSTMISPLPTP